MIKDSKDEFQATRERLFKAQHELIEEQVHLATMLDIMEKP